MTADRLPGKRLGPYVLQSLIGAGGMGEVYKALDTRLGREVAIKMLPPGSMPDEHALARFRREARAASALSHPHICTIFDVGQDELGCPYFVMELVGGQTLRSLLARGPLSRKRLIDVSIQIVGALEAAHARGIIHCDLKPGNIQVTPAGEVKLLDFGLAQLTRQHSSPETMTLVEADPHAGSPGYVSPEQALGEPLDARTDLFSVGIVLYEMATGHPAFSGPTVGATIDAVLHRTPAAPSRLNVDVSPELERVLLKALEKDRLLRYQGAAELLADLRRLQRDDQPATAAVAPLDAGFRGRRRASHMAIAALGVGILLAAGGAGAWFYWRPPPLLTDRDHVLLADFDNRSGDPVLGDALRQGLAVSLAQSPYLELVSDVRARDQLAYMGSPDDTAIAGAVAREVCIRVNAPVMLVGSVFRLGSSFVVGLEAVTCQTGDVVVREQAGAATAEELLQALDTVASRVRRRLGESLASVRKYDVRVGEATTPSLEALRALSLGDAHRFGGRPRDALQFYERAVELDRNFVLAYARLSIAYGELGQRARANQAMRVAFDGRYRVSERERLYITGQYYMNLTGELDKALDVYRLGWQTYPRDFYLAGNFGAVLTRLGRLEEAIPVFREAINHSDHPEVPYYNLADVYLSLGRLDEAEATCKEAVGRKADRPETHDLLYTIAVIRGDESTERQTERWAAGQGPATRLAVLEVRSYSALSQGKLRLASALEREALALQKQAVGGARVSLVSAISAFQLVELGRPTAGREKAAGVLAAASGPIAPSGIAAIALARAGDSSTAERVLVEFERQYPTNSLVSRIRWSIRATMAAASGRPEEAIQLLEHVASVEPFGPGAPLTMYLRATAYLQAGAGDKAAAEFQRILDRRHGGVDPMLVAPLAQVGLARALSRTGDQDGALHAYARFLEWWKEADPDVPLLLAAKQEHARLAGSD